MTLIFMRPAIALALALSLAACGGKATFPVNGTITGLSYDGLVLSTNGMNLAVPANATSFSFPNSLSYGEVYNVVQATPPLHQTCTVATVAYTDANGNVLTAGSDTAGRLSSINIGVSCALNTFGLSGNITGLTSDGLMLTNGSTGGTVAPVAGSTTFVLPNVAYGVSYGVTVLNQPANDVCSVSPNGTGVMADAAVADIAVTCVPR